MPSVRRRLFRKRHNDDHQYIVATAVVLITLCTLASNNDLIWYTAEASISFRNVQLFAISATAGIFGGSNQGSKQPQTQQQQEQQQQHEHVLPPPPPPPPPPQHLGTVQELSQEQQLHAAASQNSAPPSQEEPAQEIESLLQVPQTATTSPILPTSTQQQQEQTIPSWTGISQQQQHHQQQQQQQQQQNNEIQSYQNQLYYLQNDLEISYLREQQLINDIHNLTISLNECTQRERLHMHQLDVLTERVIDVETKSAHDRNQVLEYERNCTELLQQLEIQKQFIDEWQQKCESLIEQQKVDETAILDLKKKIKESTREVERLATMIEEYRLQDERVSSKKKGKNKKLGFFVWLFGFRSDDDDDGNDDDRTEMYETARSSLLIALQNERENVNELESALVSFQQNNSIIHEQIQSRDQLIEELNDRINGYEDEKLVLKAALRQLQLEMNDEVPKTQKLIDDLEYAHGEVTRLTEEIESIMELHKEDIASMQNTINDNIEELIAAESNLTIIGTYVDKLEERLADFTVARRDIEEREIVCKDLESKVDEISNQRDLLQVQVKELEKEHDELKLLLSELVQERSNLLDQLNISNTNNTLLERDVQNLRQSYAKVDNEARSLRELYKGAQDEYNEISFQLNDTTSHNVQLQHELKQLNDEMAKLRVQADTASNTQSDQQGILEEALTLRTTLESRIVALEKELQDLNMDYNVFRQTAHETSMAKERELERIRLEQQKALEEAATASDLFKKQSDALTLLENQVKLMEETATSRADLILKNESIASVSMHDKENTVANNTKLGVITKESSTIPEQTESSKRQFGGPMVHGSTTNSITASSAIRSSTMDTATSVTTTQALIPISQSNRPSVRNVPLRQLRKLFAKVTGVHGLFTKPTPKRR